MKKLLSLPPNLVDCFNELESLRRSEWFCASDPVGHRVGSGGGTAWLLDECYREECGCSENAAEVTTKTVQNVNVDNVVAANSGLDALELTFADWLAREKRILLHAGGQSRRLPAYAPSGKILTPVPVFRWERGQRLRQHLLSLQLPLYERIMDKAPDGLRTLIASGDVYIRSEEALQPVPQADVVCYGLWTDLSLASRHGVFAARRETPDRLDFMLQKPSLSKLEELSSTHFLLMDIGIWLLSDRAVEVLMRRSYRQDSPGSVKGEVVSAGTSYARPESRNIPSFYDLYSDFGPALGDKPVIIDEDINQLTVAIVSLQGGEFYHYGTSRELITSTLAIQNKVYDQRRVLQRKVKPHPAMFVQNAQVGVQLLPENDTIWIENSYVGKRWKLSREHILTGVPENDWELTLTPGMCIDAVPIRIDELIVKDVAEKPESVQQSNLQSEPQSTLNKSLLANLQSDSQSNQQTSLLSDLQLYPQSTQQTSLLADPQLNPQSVTSNYPSLSIALRCYGIDDAFRGSRASARWMGRPVVEWMSERAVTDKDLPDFEDLQLALLFPVLHSVEEMGLVIRWMTTEPALIEGRDAWLRAEKVSADELSARADLTALYTQRAALRRLNMPVLAANYDRSVFYQSDLADMAIDWTADGLPAPEVLPPTAGLLHRMHNRMFRARCFQIEEEKKPADKNSISLSSNSTAERAGAYQLMREALFGEVGGSNASPRLNVLSDQIVWSRSPVRIDLAGGWTDTPPYSLYAGGSVVNMAIELNSQQPLQVYLKPSAEKTIVLRSIDMGAAEVVSTWEELLQYNRVGSPFSIPKAALSLAGFGRESGYPTLRHQLEAFGAGIELTLLAAIPAGSGLGTSSLLASTVLGGLNDFCGLGWDRNDICLRTLALEQLLTTGGGWQDQYGGVLQGVKWLQTDAGLRQSPSVSWLPEYIFTQPDFSNCHLLYYTGITRTAKHILSEIVEGMFLNSSQHLALLAQMKDHASEMATAIQKGDFNAYGKLIATTWSQNKALDSGTNPPAVEAIIRQIRDFTNGYKLPGAGGGGYLYMVAKDPEAAVRIRQQLTSNAPNPRARFVEMKLSDKGLQISRS